MIIGILIGLAIEAGVAAQIYAWTHGFSALAFWIVVLA